MPNAPWSTMFPNHHRTRRPWGKWSASTWKNRRRKKTSPPPSSPTTKSSPVTPTAASMSSTWPPLPRTRETPAAPPLTPDRSIFQIAIPDHKKPCHWTDLSFIVIRFGCPNCDASLTAADNQAGTLGSCASCRAAYTAPRRGDGTAGRRLGPMRPSTSGQMSPLALLFLKVVGYVVGAVCGFFGYDALSHRSRPPAAHADYTPTPVAPTPPAVPMPLQSPP